MLFSSRSLYVDGSSLKKLVVLSAAISSSSGFIFDVVGVFNDYLHRIIENTEQFLRRIRWKAHFFLNPDTASPS